MPAGDDSRRRALDAFERADAYQREAFSMGVKRAEIDRIRMVLVRDVNFGSIPTGFGIIREMFSGESSRREGFLEALTVALHDIGHAASLLYEICEGLEREIDDHNRQAAWLRRFGRESDATANRQDQAEAEEVATMAARNWPGAR